MQASSFIVQNWPLIIMFLIPVYLILKLNKPDDLGVDTKELVDLINMGEVDLYDIREKEEHDKCFILSSKHENVKDLIKNNKKSNKTIVVICKNGHKSASFVQKTIKNQKLKIKYLQGGIDEWLKFNLPVLNN